MSNEFELVILSAGESKRFGSPKQLALWEGVPLLQHVIDLAHCLHIEPWLTLGAHRDAIISNKKLDLSCCRIIVVENWQKGVSASIKSALKEIIKTKPMLKGVVFLLADQPMLEPDSLKILFAAIQKNSEQIICSEYQDTVGVPAFFPRKYFDDLLLLEGDCGAKSIIEANLHHLVKMNQPLIDIDVPEDIFSIRASLTKKSR